MRISAIAFIVSLFFSNIALAEDAVYVLDTPQLSCSYTSAEAKQAVRDIDNVRFVSSDKRDHTLTVSVDTSETTIAQVVQSLDEPLFEEGGTSLLDIFADPGQEPPDTGAVRSSDRALLAAVLSRLDEREQVVIRGYYGIDADQAQTLERIGSRLGVSRERVRQIRERALNRLRHPSIVRDLQALVAEE